MESRTNQPFTEALGTMLRERSGDRMGRFPLAPFIAQIGDKTGLNYEYIRLMLRDQRTLRTDVIEAAAEALGVPPSYFIEYRQLCVKAQMERHPTLTNKLYDITKAFLAELGVNSDTHCLKPQDT